MKHTTQKDGSQQMNESQPRKGKFQDMKVRIFNSFEEAAAAEAHEAAQQAPLERIKETVALILRVYGVTQTELNHRKRDLHVNIIRYE